MRLTMDTTIRNLDERIYRKLKARAALLGQTVGEAVNEALRSYLARPDTMPKTGSVRDLIPEAFAAGTEHLSADIDRIVYGG